MTDSERTVLVTGGAGYLGSVLVPKLLAKYRVVVLDALWFGDEGLAAVKDHPRLRLIPGDLRRDADVRAALAGDIDAVIHLAAVSNDPCSELDPELTRSVNLEATRAFMRWAKEAGVRRFLNASSASVYGIKSDPDVTEDLPLEPLTLYAECKADTEETLRELVDDRFCGVSVRAATVCGLSPRLRLDLSINILSYHALTRGSIRVFGGDQLRPNIHIQDLTDFYVHLLELPPALVRGRSFNVVRSNASMLELARMVQAHVSPDIPIEIVPTADNRSYHLSGARAEQELDFRPAHELGEAVDELRAAFFDGRVPDPHDPRHRNVEVMKAHPERTRSA